MSKINSIEELDKARAADKISGSQPVDYKAWENDMKELEKLGVPSTGSASGDKAKLRKMEEAAQEMIKEAQAQQKAQEIAKQKNLESNKVEEASKNDSEQQIKATVANATSSQILDNYIRWQIL
jgi:hypothetical protein